MMETHVPNAFATGRNPKNSVVAVTRGLMSRLDEKEIEAQIRTVLELGQEKEGE